MVVVPGTPKDQKPTAGLLPPAALAERAVSGSASIDPEEYGRSIRTAEKNGIEISAAQAAMQSGTDATKALVMEDREALRELIAGNRRAAKWLADPDNAAIAQGDYGNINGIQRTMSKVKPRGAWSEIWENTQSGFTGLRASYYHLAATTGLLTPEEAAYGSSQANRTIRQGQARASPTVVAYRRRIDQSSGIGVIPAALSNLTGFASLVTESIGFSAPSLIGGVAGGVVGGLPGAVAASFGGGVVSETGAWINQEIAAAGYDLSDYESTLKAYSDPVLMARIQAEGVRKGVTTAGIDALSLMFGGAILSPIRKAGILRKAAGFGKELAIQSGLEVFGEGAGQFAAVGEVDVKDSLLEGVASLGQSIGEISLGTALRRSRPIFEAAVGGNQAKQDAEAFRGAAKLWVDSKAAKRAPQRMRDLVTAMVQNQDPERAAVYLGREEFDKVAGDAGLDPAEEIEKLVTDAGREEYLKSEQTGFVRVPFGSFVEYLSGLGDLEPLLSIARFRSDGLSVAEAEGAVEDAQQAVTEDVHRNVSEAMNESNSLLQEAKGLQQEKKDLDDQIKALGTVLKKTETGEDPPELLAARGRQKAIQERLGELAKLQADQLQKQKKAVQEMADTLRAAGAPADVNSLALVHMVMREVMAQRANIEDPADFPGEINFIPRDDGGPEAPAEADPLPSETPPEAPVATPEQALEAPPEAPTLPADAAEPITLTVDNALRLEKMLADEGLEGDPPLSQSAFTELENLLEVEAFPSRDDDPAQRKVLTDLSPEAQRWMSRQSRIAHESQPDLGFQDLAIRLDEAADERVGQASLFPVGPGPEPVQDVGPPQRARPITEKAPEPAPAEEDEPPDATAPLGDEPANVPVSEPGANAPALRTANQANRLSNAIDLLLNNNTALKFRELQLLAEQIYGGTLAEGAFDAQDIANAAELAVNKRVAKLKPATDFASLETQLDVVGTYVSNLPTQTRRTQQKIDFQQFSTPQDYAGVAAWAANLSPSDTVLEPSAGTGNIAAWAEQADTTLIVNEIDEKRARLLERGLNPDSVFSLDGEQLNNLLPPEVSPDVVLMNPPFSNAGNRGARRDLMVGARHIEQALKRLKPGGRLVAIVGRGMSMDAPTFRAWWARIGKQYNVLANIPVSGNVYKKLGTSFGTRLLVIDNAASTDSAVAGVGLEEVESLPELAGLLTEIRDGRVQGSAEQSGTQGAAGAQRTSRPARPARTDADGGRSRPAERPAPSGATAPGDAPRVDAGTGAPVDGGPQGGNEGDQPATKPGRDEGRGDGGGAAGPSARPDVGDAGATASTDPIPVAEDGLVEGASADPVITTAEIAVPSDIGSEPEPGLSELAADGEEEEQGVFEKYSATAQPFPQAKDHPVPLAESAAMASVSYPEVTQVPKLPKKAVEIASKEQIEAVAVALEAHTKSLSDGSRQGVMIGDGTGVGKTFEAAMIVLDQILRGNKKHLWVTKNSQVSLFDQIRRDWALLGGPKDHLLSAGKVKSQQSLPDSGTLVIGYGGLAQGINFQEDGTFTKSATQKGQSRMEQLEEWMGVPEDYDGVIIFDESHMMASAVDGDFGKKASSRAKAGLYLQRKFPKARVVYLSATGATEVANLGYAERLGLWGPGKAFETVTEFIAEIGNRGLAAMEMVARDLKSMGVYMSRTLTMSGVKYDQPLVHELTEEQSFMYERVADSWQVIIQNIEEVLKEQNVGGRERGRVRGRFWSFQQRFFNQLLTSMQMPTLIEGAKKDLKAGHSVVLQITNHDEARLKRAEAKLEARRDAGEEVTDDDLEISPKDDLIDLLMTAFPVYSYQDVVNPETGNKSREVVVYPVGHPLAGQPVVDLELAARRDALVADLDDLRIPDGPVDIILQEFGADNVAEVTGRSSQVIRDSDGNRLVRKRNKALSNKAEVSAFMGDKKQIIMFSMAGGTGMDYHADLRVKNQRLRRHYVVQAGWQADAAIQGFGRTHRSNQKQPPEYILVSTNIAGHKRFMSSIARRIEQLGALTKGQRDATGGVFSEKDNLESKYAQAAVRSLIIDIALNRVEGFNQDTLTLELGWSDMISSGSITEKGMAKADVTGFLNRLLSLRPDRQNELFGHFANRLEAAIDAAKTSGTFDSGMQELQAEKVSVTSEETVNVDAETGAETQLLTLDVTRKIPRMAWGRARNLYESFFVNARSGRIWAAGKIYERTLRGGGVEDVHAMFGPSGRGSAVPVHQLGRFSDTYKQVGLEEAEKIWEVQHAEVPKVGSAPMSLLTGVTMPIWNRIPDTGDVFRVKLPDGRKVIGLEVPQDQVDGLRSNLGLDREQVTMTPKAVGDAALAGKSITLANGFVIRSARVAGELRIELLGATGFHYRRLQQAGVFVEIHQSKRRAFIPVGNETAMAAVMLGQDITRVASASGGSLQQAARDDIPGLPPEMQEGFVPPAPEVPFKDDTRSRLETLSTSDIKSIFLEREPGINVETDDNGDPVTREDLIDELTGIIDSGEGEDIGIESIQPGPPDLSGIPNLDASNEIKRADEPPPSNLEERIADAKRERDSLQQEGQGPAPRGETFFTPKFGEPLDTEKHGRRIFDVNFYKDADASTFFHEMAHVWLEMLGDLQVRESVPQQIRDDFAEILSFLGVDGRAGIDEAAHERFAEAFERYIATAEAPSARLRTIFSQFRAWMLKIYEKLRGLEVELSDEMVGVFDRMLASDAEIAAAQYELGSQVLPSEAVGAMTENERVAYLRGVLEVQATTEARMTRDVLLTQAQQLQALRGEEMERIRKRVRKSLESEPAVLAIRDMENGNTDKFLRSELVDIYGDGAEEIKALEDMDLVSDDGADPNEIASQYAFGSGDSLVKAVLHFTDFEQVVETESRIRLEKERPELMGTRSIRATARRAVANEQRSLLLAREYRLLRKLANRKSKKEKGALPQDQELKDRVDQDQERLAEGEKAVGPLKLLLDRTRELFTPTETLDQIKAEALADLNTIKLRDLRPHLYMTSARRESRKSAQRIRIGDMVGAAEAKRRELGNHERFRIATKIVKQAERDRSRAQFFAGERAQKVLTRAGFTYSDQMNDLLERFRFKRISGPEAERRKTLAQWLVEQEAAGATVIVPMWLVADSKKTDHQQLTGEELNELRETMEAIFHLANTKDRMKSGQRKRRRSQVNQEVAQRIAASKPEKDIIKGAETQSELTRELGESFLAGGTKTSYWTRIMDGDQDGGPVTNAVVRVINDATDNKAVEQRVILETLAGFYQKHFDKETRKRINKRRDFAGADLTHEDRLAILGHMGNPEGVQRLGQVFTSAQIQAIMDATTAADVAFVEDRWRMFDELFQRSVKQQEQLVGQTPKAVEHTPFTVEIDGEEVRLSGGYHPIAYKNPHLFSRDEGEVARAKAARAGSLPSQMFPNSFLKSRNEKVTGQVRLDRGVVVGHLMDVTHSLTMREAVLDVQSVLYDQQVSAEISSRYGKHALKGMRDWLLDVAADGGSPRTGLDKVLGYLRHGSVTATLGFRVVSALMQVYGFRQTAIRVGWKWTFKGVQKWLGDPKAAYGAESWIDAKSKFMSERRRGTYQRELNELRGSMPGRFRTEISHHAFYMLSQVQRAVDQMTWIAQYEKSLDAKPDGADITKWDIEAVAQADQAVKDSQSGGQIVDLSDWERGGPLLRMLTTYFTDAGLKFNQTRLSASRTKWKDPGSFGRFLGDMTLLYFTEAALIGLYATTFGDDDEDDAVLETMFRETAGSIVDTMPLLRELSGPIKGYRYRGTAGLAQVGAAVGAAQQVGQFFGDGPDAGEVFDPSLWKSLSTLTGTMLGLPSKAINDAGESISQVFEGEIPTAFLIRKRVR